MLTTKKKWIGSFLAVAMAAAFWGQTMTTGAFAQETPPPAPAAAAAPAPAEAPAEEEAEDPVGDYKELLDGQAEYAPAYDFFVTSMLWTVIAAALVFLMHLGFATLESGLTQSKNTVNILFKNVFIVSIGIITYALVGFNSHYPGDFNGWFSFGWRPIGDLNAEGGATWGYGGLGLAMTGFGDFIFQAMFAATAATIVSGAVAERIKLLPFMIFATLLVGFAYPVVGSWHWGGGWLGDLSDGAGFKDFAGSAVVHAFGGFAALACVLLLGPRKGKYVDGKISPIPGHNMPLAAIGVFLLFFGWFGFNGGSVLSAEPAALGLVFTTTTLAACAGALASIVVSWVFLRTPDLSMALNGILAGLVGITANADIVSAMGSIIIGLVAGVIVVFSIVFFDKIRIDDPVGAISVHGVCGVWGILACAIFDTTDSGFTIAGQLTGVAAVAAAAFIFSLVVFGVIKVVMGSPDSYRIHSQGALDRVAIGGFLRSDMALGRRRLAPCSPKARWDRRCRSTRSLAPGSCGSVGIGALRR
jgi:Amt family ammonium transporter